eukprot:2557245-Rhodomonas_salina.1
MGKAVGPADFLSFAQQVRPYNSTPFSSLNSGSRSTDPPRRRTLPLRTRVLPLRAETLPLRAQHRTRAVDLIARRDPWSAPADAGAGRKEGGEYVFGVLPVKEERDATDRFLFLLMCAVPIIFGCSGLAWTLYTL